MAKVERNSNIEILRIICMSLIVLAHFIYQSNAYDISDNIVFITIFGNGHKIAVNLFLLIGSWFMVDRPFSAERILKLYGNVWIYTAGISMLMLTLGNNIGIVNFCVNFFPFIGSAVWYASAYIALMFIAPFLNRVFQWNRMILRNFLVVMFALICIETMIRHPIDDWTSWILWFGFVFLSMGYYKKYIHGSYTTRYKIFLFTGIVLYLFLSAIIIGVYKFGIPDLFGKLAKRYLTEIHTAPNIIISFFIFLYFINRKPFYNHIVNKIGGLTFSVYIIHQTKGFYPFLWHNIFRCDEWIGGPYFEILSVGVVLAVFLITFLAEIIRKKIFEPLWIKSKLFKLLAKKLNEFYDLTE